MNATITFSIAVNPSTALTGGISFGTIAPPITNQFAINDTTGPYDMNTTHNNTDYNLTVDSTTSRQVDFFNKAQYGYLNNSNNETILIENVTLEANSSWSGENLNYSIEVEPNDIELNITWRAIGHIHNTTDDLNPCNNTAHDGTGYCAMMYWLDVPANQPSGDYNTTYCYCAVEVGEGSGACSC